MATKAKPQPHPVVAKGHAVPAKSTHAAAAKPKAKGAEGDNTPSDISELESFMNAHENSDNGDSVPASSTTHRPVDLTMSQTSWTSRGAELIKSGEVDSDLLARGSEDLRHKLEGV